MDITQKYLAVVLSVICIVGGCSWRQITTVGPPDIPREKVPEVMRQFDEFGKFLAEEQRINRDTPYEGARRHGFGFLIDVCAAYENLASASSDDQKVYTGKCLEGYDAFREWWKGYDKPASVKFGKREITPNEYERLRYFEVELMYEAVYGHSLHEEAVQPKEIRVIVRDKLELIALDSVILDVRKEHWTKKEEEIYYEHFAGRIGRYFVAIINAVLGNGPANMAPTPKIQ